MRKVKLEGRAFSHRAAHLDVAGALLDNPEAGRKPQSSPFARRLCGVEGLEKVGFHLLGHPDAAVRHGQHNVLAWTQIRQTFPSGLVNRHVGSADSKPSAVGHGIARVEREVHDHLLDLTQIGFDVARSRIEFCLKFDVLPDQPPQHPFCVADHRVKFEDAGFNHLFAAEGQQLARERRRQGGAFLDLLRVFTPRVAGLELPQQHFAVTADGSQHVVEVMSNASGQPRDGLEFLRLTQLLLTVAQRFFSRLPGRARLRFENFPLDGGHQPRELAFHDVVMRARLHRCHGRFLAHHRRDEDEWQILPAPL